MKKSIKKLLGAALTAAMCLALLPVQTVKAEEDLGKPPFTEEEAKELLYGTWVTEDGREITIGEQFAVDPGKLSDNEKTRFLEGHEEEQNYSLYKTKYFYDFESFNVGAEYSMNVGDHIDTLDSWAEEDDDYMYEDGEYVENDEYEEEDDWEDPVNWNNIDWNDMLSIEDEWCANDWDKYEPDSDYGEHFDAYLTIRSQNVSNTESESSVTVCLKGYTHYEWEEYCAYEVYFTHKILENGEKVTAEELLQPVLADLPKQDVKTEVEEDVTTEVEEDAKTEIKTAAGRELQEGESVYIVKPGDCLWSIARTLLGDGRKYTELFTRNNDIVEKAVLIFPGQEIIVPAK